MATTEKVRMNREITAPQLRVIGAAGENLGVITTAEALKAAQDAELDLIEISPNAVPPVAKIMDYGKFQYELKKNLIFNGSQASAHYDTLQRIFWIVRYEIVGHGIFRTRRTDEDSFTVRSERLREQRA